MDKKTAQADVTVFSKSAEAVRKEYGNVRLDPAEFQRKDTIGSLLVAAYRSIRTQ
jgi:hypothetical protein